MIIFTDFPPTAQKRPRVTKFVTYDPSAKDKVEFIKTIKSQLPEKPLTSPLAVKIKFLFRRPKSHYNSKGELKRFMPFCHSKKPDIDNLYKFVLDALNNNLYLDDSQVVSLAGRKQYAQEQGIEIDVRELSELNFDERDGVLLANKVL